MILALTDMPSGWSTLPSDPGGDGCESIPGLRASAAEAAIADFAAPSGVPQVAASVGVFAAGEAAAYLRELRAGIPDCREFDDDGNSFTLDPSNLAALGDESVSYVIRGSVDGFNIVIYAVMVRIGDVVSLTAHADLGGDPDEATRFARLAAAKVRAQV